MIDAARRAAARAVLFAAHRRFGNRAFRVDLGGPNLIPLLDAERLGWAWFVDDDWCVVTQAGRRELEPGALGEAYAIIQYLCPVCARMVVQPDRGDGLPADVPCPHCAETLAGAVRLFEETRT